MPNTHEAADAIEQNVVMLSENLKNLNTFIATAKRTSSVDVTIFEKSAEELKKLIDINVQTVILIRNTAV
jgi:hypothetical protein